MTDEKSKIVYISEDPGFLERLIAVIANTAPLASTTIVVSGTIAPATGLERPAQVETPTGGTTGREPKRHFTKDSAPKPSAALTLDPAFKMALAVSAGLTGVMLLACVILVLSRIETDSAHSLLNTCEHLMSAGAGGIVSLLGSKAGVPFRSSKK